MENTEKLLEEPSEISPADIGNMKVADLKRELKARNLSVVGNKPELIERLQQFISKGFDSLESADEVNEDEVLADVALLTSDDPKSQEISEDEILGGSSSKDDLEDPLELLATKPKPAPPPAPVEKTKITLSRGLSLVTTKEVTEEKVKTPITPSVDASKENRDITLKLAKLSTEERLALRAKKFNQPLPVEAKLNIRSERFGITSKTAQPSFKASLPVITKMPADVEKLKVRAERFGQTISTDLKQAEDKEKLLKRKQRFGTLTSSSSISLSTNDEEKKKRRTERFQAS